MVGAIEIIAGFELQGFCYVVITTIRKACKEADALHEGKYKPFSYLSHFFSLFWPR